MADVIQGLGLIEKFSLIFPFLFVLVIVYAILTKTKVLGESQGVNSFIALIVAVLVLLTPPVTQIVNYMAPWFVVLFLFAIFMIIGVMVLGPTESDVISIIKSEKWGSTIIMWIIA